VAFFAGCTAAFRQPEIGQAALRILARSGTEFCMLQERESCCGSFLFRTGSDREYADTICSMIEEYRSRGVTTILVACAGCLKTITVNWPRVYGKALPFRVMPFAAFVRDLIRQKKIRFRPSSPVRVVYHDPCHGGRHLMHHLGGDLVFEAPREVISAIPGTGLVEFEKNRKHQVCCGAGGGIKARDPDLATAIAREKIAAADRSGADLLVSTCPFCRRNFDDTRRAMESGIEVQDIIQLVERMMERQP
jgi:heterodisulfide reductase subunit D